MSEEHYLHKILLAKLLQPWLLQHSHMHNNNCMLEAEAVEAAEAAEAAEEAEVAEVVVEVEVAAEVEVVVHQKASLPQHPCKLEEITIMAAEL